MRVDSSPFGGGADIVVKEITRQCFALPPSLLKRDAALRAENMMQRNHPSRLCLATLFVKEGNLISRFATASPIGEAFVRRVAPRSFGYAQNDKVGCVCFAKDFSATAKPSLEMTRNEVVRRPKESGETSVKNPSDNPLDCQLPLRWGRRGRGAPKMWCKEITRQRFTLTPSLLKRETSFVSAVGTATFPNRGRLTDKV
jgi:hypothetical protein